MSVTMSRHGRDVVRSAVAAAVRRILRSKSESVGELAARLTVSPTTIVRWADKGDAPNFNAATRIAPLVGLDPLTGRPKS